MIRRLKNADRTQLLKKEPILYLSKNEYNIYSGAEWPEFIMPNECPCCDAKTRRFLVLNLHVMHLHRWIAPNEPKTRESIHRILASFCEYHGVSDYVAWNDQSTMRQIIKCFPIASIFINEETDETINRGYTDDLSVIIYSEAYDNIILFTPVFYQQFIAGMKSIDIEEEQAQRFYFHSVVART